MENMVFKENGIYYTWKRLLIKDEVTGEDVEPLVKVKVDLPLFELCNEIKNFFVTEIKTRKFEIDNGKITPLDFIQENQYFRIVGSVFNDGVYMNTADLELTNEVFCGAVWSMAVPPSVVDLAAEIKKYNESDEAKPSAYNSESFGGYAYTKATNSDGTPIRWQDVFKKSLNKWRKI
ncbi:MAG: hypothetical protein J6D52_07750 [Clostridia bacterium]|nr:hypothetical protein [Clostridia bacterium]